MERLFRAMDWWEQRAGIWAVVLFLFFVFAAIVMSVFVVVNGLTATSRGYSFDTLMCEAFKIQGEYAIRVFVPCSDREAGQ